MRKIIALMLSFVIILSAFALPVTAVTEVKEKCPIILIPGSSGAICNAEGQEISTGFDVVTDDDEGDMTTDKIMETVMNILKPFLLEGLPFDKWDNYGKAVYEELAPIWDETQLGGDGNAKYGTTYSVAKWKSNNKKAQTVNTGSDGTFNFYDYQFIYDWRLSPYDSVDRLHQYIKDVIKTTKCKQVALVGRCLGGSLVTAYLDVYGDEGLVKKVVYDEVMSNGSSIINDCFTGKIAFSDKHIQAYLLQTEYFALRGEGIDLEGVSEFALELIENILDYITEAGILDVGLYGLDALYQRLYEALIPALLRATGIGTWANYWCSVYEEDFDEALDFVFGEEGTQTREEYAGLIEKINRYRENITAKAPHIYKQFEEEYEIEFAVIAGYGLVNAPIMEHYDETSDCTVGFPDASFGGSSVGLFDTYSEKYVEYRTQAGYGHYVSPDRKVDLSTCVFPETTWVIKNKHHDYARCVDTLVEYFTQYTNVTAVRNNRNYSQFLVFDRSSPTEFVNMTEENMADGRWITDVNQAPSFRSIFEAFIKMLKSIWQAIELLFDNLAAK